MRLIDKTKPLNFTFNRKSYQGFEGDTLASALLRNGVSIVARSFKYHRPRGIFGAGSEEPNALVQIINGKYSEPNRLATTIKLFEGLDAKSQNYIGSVNRDLLAVNDLLSPFLAAGFYYKTFMWPKSFWEKLYEPAIRRAAGLGSLTLEPDPDKYDKGFLHCDILIIGAGPAGLRMAINAGRANKSVIIVDEDFHLGGRLLSDKGTIDAQDASAWAAQMVAELQALPNIRLMPRTTLFGVYDHGIYGALEIKFDKINIKTTRQVLWRIYAGHAVLAAGATERPMAFANNDRPGIMLASAMRTYQNRYGIDFKKTALFINNDDALSTQTDHIVDVRNNETIIDTRGRKHIKSVKLNNNSTIAIDYLAISGGWNPNIHLTCHKRGRPIWNKYLSCFVPNNDQLPSDMQVIGAANGTFSTQGAFDDADKAAKKMGLKISAPPRSEDEPVSQKTFWHVKGKKRAWVDFQNDVTAKDIYLAHQEGFSSVEHVKRYTTLGMGTDQGKTANVVGLAILADATGQTIPQTGTTIFRPPYTPVSIGAFAGPHKGQHFKQTRLTPSHKYAEETGAIFVETGYWKRTQWVPKNDETFWRDSVDREVKMTRSSVGICDVSTLGKIDIQGKDAGKFLNRIYANTFSTLKVGKCRYGLMLREDGFAMDDGTTARLSETHYVMTTTTANAGLVYRHLEFVKQCLYPDIDVHFMSTTDQWAQFSVAGPNARKLLQRLVDDAFDISNDAFPYMACDELTICSGIRARLFRLSFSGEIAYEISVPARYGDALIRRLMAEGEALDAVLYGTEALGVMRIEKGHAAGNEINGQTTAANLGLGKFVSKKKDCIGKVLSQREGLTLQDGLRLVGFKAANTSDKITNGAHLISKGNQPTPENDEGHLTSVAWSPMLECYIALGLIKNGSKRIGETVRAVDFMRDNHIDLEIVSPHFFDPEGERLHV